MQAWEKFLASQEKELGQETVRKWLRTLKVLRFDAGNLYLEAQDSFQALWFEEHLRQKVYSKLFNNNNKRIKVHLTVANTVLPPMGSKTRGKRHASQQVPAPPSYTLTFDELDPQCTFKHFVISDGNLLISKLLSEVTQSLPPQTQLSTFNPIYIHGMAGTGKTHLLMATAHTLRQQGHKVIYTHAETFTEHVVSAIRAGEMSAFRHAYRNVDLLFIDDVHVFSRKGATQEEFFHTFNTLHLENKQIILSANCSPMELQFIEPRLISRFEWGIVLPLEPLNKEEIRQVLLAKATALQCNLDNKIIEFLIGTFTSSPKVLIRALKALVLRTHLNDSNKLNGASLTVPIVRNVLADLINEEHQAALTPDKIIQTVAEFYGIKADDILSKAQSRDCALPRQIAMFLCRNKLNIPYAKIGNLFSRDHSTVMSSVRLVQKGLEEASQDIISSIATISKKL